MPVLFATYTYGETVTVQPYNYLGWETEIVGAVSFPDPDEEFVLVKQLLTRQTPNGETEYGAAVVVHLLGVPIINACGWKANDTPETSENGDYMPRVFASEIEARIVIDIQAEALAADVWEKPNFQARCYTGLAQALMKKTPKDFGEGVEVTPVSYAETPDAISVIETAIQTYGDGVGQSVLEAYEEIKLLISITEKADEVEDDETD